TQTLHWQQLTTPLSTTAAQLYTQVKPHSHLFQLQPRLLAAIKQFCQPQGLLTNRLLLLNAPDTVDYLQQLQTFITAHYSPATHDVTGYRYIIHNQRIQLIPTQDKNANFTAKQFCLAAQWLEHEQLFGHLLCEEPSNKYRLQPGLIHQLNHGILMLPINTLLMQPLLWQRLKNCLLSGMHHWQSKDENASLPVTIPPIPVDLRLILVGDHQALSDWQLLEPLLFDQAVYIEHEKNYTVNEQTPLNPWLSYLKTIQRHFNLPPLTDSAVALL